MDIEKKLIQIDELIFYDEWLLYVVWMVQLPEVSYKIFGVHCLIKLNEKIIKFDCNDTHNKGIKCLIVKIY
mgnify:CR=1 FL=1